DLRYFGRIAHVNRMEMGWQHANDSRGAAVQVEGASDHRRIRPEATPPQGVAQDDDAFVRLAVFLRSERPGELHRDAERVEERRADAHPAQDFGLAAIDERELRVAVERDALYRATPIAPLLHRPDVHTILAAPGSIVLPDGHQAIRRRIWQLP